ncbi:MAG: DNA polymerase III subunit delta [Candidatus Dactylopiibacterium carminicum]|uniref:DNA polymerase III subunit delta n=1 Tax=Candidatus Dactylopiibacterium carminicum TaxID=857335 RepID=A0A272ET13_9RHOO|nr:DNA polymerase III subunit delta [Candidatus Dactylopiibacterium carminicum]KAF7599165.1 DNA polymerase III subunit delta [Candidatus Dactylopiibacterium carminicum]PAS93263.1 MAG: DNA polymerase III subunit delta [Candidatus Dactylopiibacterium carminicum]PAS99179.1 MAG: DNA polymerase III subunit delta [Candidatus Dactylopiibacterium carminicum]
MPALRPEALAEHLSRPLSPLYVVHGDEPLLVLEAADAIRAAARAQGVTEREVLVTHQYFRWDEFGLASGALSLFGDRSLVDLRIPNGKPGKQGGEALTRFARELDPQGDSLTLITLPLLDWATRKTAWFTALSEAGFVIECNAPELARLPDWIAQRLARQQQHAPREALEFIAGHVEGNLLAAHQEIQKLGLLHEPGELSLAQVEDAVLHVARYDTEKLRAALLEGDAPRCARLLEGLKGEGAAPPLVLWAMSNEIRTLANVRGAMDGGQSVDAALKTERVFGPHQGPCKRAAQRLKAGGLRAALLHAARIDRIIKGLERGDVWDEFLQLSLRLRLR